MKTHTRVLLAILLAFLAALSYAQAPVPFINQPLVPDATPPGGAQFTLTVNGTGFVSSSVVNWNGNALATQFVNGSQLTATVPAADISKASTGWVTVVNPAPGGGTSNVTFFPVTVGTPSVAFVPASFPVVGNLPESLAVGDFNGDGKLDLAVANLDSNASVLLGDGTGNLSLVSSPAAGSGPDSVAVGDFNGDGKLDLAVADYFVNAVSILLGDGAGTFTLASSPVVGNSPASLAAGDFNGDGKLDLAVANYYSNTVSILLGDGTGNFTLASSESVGSGPYSIAVGDFNGDGKLDLATTNEYGGTVSILLGDGTGNFTLISSPGVISAPTSVAVGDFNGDGKLDLAVANGPSSTVSILLGDGTGNFTLASFPAVGGWPYSVAVGDFNGDGKLDLATANYSSDNVSILLGDGTGNFTLASSPAVGSYPSSVAVGDFNGDGKLDLAVTNDWDNTVSILLGVPHVPAVTLSPTGITFGTQLVGTSSTPQSVTLTNSGGATLAITKRVVSGGFSQTNNCPFHIPPGGQCIINVVFTPRVPDSHQGAVTITDNASNSPQMISLTGVATAVTLMPSTLSFGSQPVGTSSPPQTVTLTNYWTAAVSIGKIQINPGFAQTNTCGTDVPAGGSCTISVTFTPTYKGSTTQPLKVYDKGGASPQTVSLSGTGTNSGGNHLATTETLGFRR